MIVLPPHLVVLGLKFAAARMVHKGVERGIDIAAHQEARRGLPEGVEPSEIEARATRNARLTRHAVRLARHLRRA